MSLEKEFVPFDLNQKLIDLGLKIEKPLMFRSFSGELSYSRFEYYTPAILWQQAFDWFRDNFNIYYRISYAGRYWYEYKQGYGSTYINKSEHICETYEEARYACLEKLIELTTCKSKN